MPQHSSSWPTGAGKCLSCTPRFGGTSACTRPGRSGVPAAISCFAITPSRPSTTPAEPPLRGSSTTGIRPSGGCRPTWSPSPPTPLEIETSTGARFTATHFADAQFPLAGVDRSLPLYWLAGYAGGLLLPFSDSTGGSTTYPGGRYLLDTVKGADLGERDGWLTLDFNFAYNPSCAYNPAWVCPLAPAASRLRLPDRGRRAAPLTAPFGCRISASGGRIGA